MRHCDMVSSFCRLMYSSNGRVEKTSSCTYDAYRCKTRWKETATDQKMDRWANGQMEGHIVPPHFSYT